MNNFKEMWDFEVKEGVDFENCNSVHPLMQKRVQKILKELQQDFNVQKIVLFGSALEFRCSSFSDIDLYIEKKDKNLPLQTEPAADCEIDIVTNLEQENRLYKEIERTGLLLFDRGQQYV